MIIFKKNINIFMLLFFTSLIIKLSILIIFNFDGFYGQDSYAYYDYSKYFISSVNNLSIPPNFYFPIGFYIFTYVVNIIVLGDISLAALCVSLVSSSLIPAVTFLMAYELLKNYFNENDVKIISVFAGIILCFSGSMIQAGIVVMSDSLGLFLASTSVYFLIKYYNTRKFIYSLFSFSALSLSIITRYINAIFILFFILVIFIQFVFLKNKIRLKHLLLPLIIASIIFIPQLYYILNYGISYLRPEEGPGQWTTQWSFFNLFRNVFFIADGTFNYKIWNSIYYSIVFFHPMNFFLFGIFFFLGVYFIIIKKYRLLLLYLVSWIFLFCVFLMGMPLQASRYTLVYFPAAAVIVSVGIFGINLNYFFKKMIFISLILILFIFGLFRINNFIEHKNRDMRIVEYINNKFEANSTLFSFFITGTINHYSTKKSLELYYFNTNNIKEVIDSSKSNVYFIIPETVINTQWKGLTLEKTFDFVRTNYNPDKINEMDNYSIYCIRKL